MKKTLQKILERDNYICGLHSGGCGKTIDIKHDEPPTLDHIISKDYIKKLKNKTDFRKSWNYQPMCEKCNKKREGQIIDWPEFKCKCHGVYIDDLGVRWIMYKYREKWNRVKYLEEMKVPDEAPNEDKIVPGVMLIGGGRRNYGGAKAIGLGKFGHLFYLTTFYKRLKINAFEFERTEQWEELKKEVEKFAIQYLKDEGKLFKKESENYKYSMALWVYWDFKVQQKQRKKNNKGDIEVIKRIMKNYRLEVDKGYLEIEKIAEQLISEKIKPLKEDRFTNHPIGSIVFSKNKIYSAINEAWKNWNKGDKEQTEYLLNKIITKYPQDSTSWESRAIFRTLTGDIEGACKDITKAINLKKTASFYAVRSDIKIRMGKLKEAKKDIEQALLIGETENNNKEFHNASFINVETGEKTTIETEIKRWRQVKSQIIKKEKASDYETLQRKTRLFLAQGKWEETIKGCEEFFRKYKESGYEKFVEIMGKNSNEVRAEFYWMKITARISLKEGMLQGCCRLCENIIEEDGIAIEQEMEKEVYKIDLDDFELLTDNVKEKTKRAIEQLIKEGRIKVEKRPELRP